MIQNLTRPVFIPQADINLVNSKYAFKSLPAVGHINVQELDTQAQVEGDLAQILLAWQGRLSTHLLLAS